MVHSVLNVIWIAKQSHDFYLKQILKKRQKKSTSCYNEGGKFLIFGDSYAIAVAGVFFCCHGV